MPPYRGWQVSSMLVHVPQQYFVLDQADTITLGLLLIPQCLWSRNKREVIYAIDITPYKVENIPKGSSW